MKRTFGKVATCLMMAGAMLTGCGAEAAGNISAAAEPKVTEAGQNDSADKATDAGQNSESGKNSDAVKDSDASKAEGAAQANSGAAEMEYKGDFDKTLIDFVEAQGYADKNYMVSTTSFRAALALAVAGADTETKQQLLTAMGFENVDELNDWYAQVTEIIDEFDKEIEMDKKEFEREREYFSDDAKAPDGELTMLNSVWNNTDLNGKFSKDYIKYVEKHYGIAADTTIISPGRQSDSLLIRSSNANSYITKEAASLSLRQPLSTFLFWFFRSLHREVSVQSAVCQNISFVAVCIHIKSIEDLENTVASVIECERHFAHLILKSKYENRICMSGAIRRIRSYELCASVTSSDRAFSKRSLCRENIHVEPVAVDHYDHIIRRSVNRRPCKFRRDIFAVAGIGYL